MDDDGTMLAVVQSGYGRPEDVLRVERVPVPPVGPGEVRVRVRATSVNTPDWVWVTGAPWVLRLRFGLRGPANPVRGTDVAGVVLAVGAGVADLQPGDEVFGSTWREDQGGPGAFAEQTVVPARQLLRKPPGLSFAHAAGAVMSGITALLAVSEAKPGAKVLVNGASGGVGTFAVQIARARGAEVTGVCGPDSVELVRSLGAHHVVDYTKDDFTRLPARYDLVLDNVLNHPPRRTVRVLAPGGVFVPNSVGNTGGWLAGLPRMGAAVLLHGGRTVRCVVDPDTLGGLASLLESGAVRVVVDRVYPAEQTAAAVAHLLGHHARGKVIVEWGA